MAPANSGMPTAIEKLNPVTYPAELVRDGSFQLVSFTGPVAKGVSAQAGVDADCDIGGEVRIPKRGRTRPLDGDPPCRVRLHRAKKADDC